MPRSLNIVTEKNTCLITNYDLLAMYICVLSLSFPVCHCEVYRQGSASLRLFQGACEQAEVVHTTNVSQPCQDFCHGSTLPPHSVRLAFENATSFARDAR